MRKDRKEYFAVSLVHNKGTNVIGCSAHQTRREFICSLRGWKHLPSLPFLTVWYRNWASPNASPQRHAFFTKKKMTMSSQRQVARHILLNVRKNTLSPSVVEERTHEYLNEKCGVRGKKEISLGLHCNTSSEEDHRHALLADLIFGNVWFLVHAGSRRSTSLRLRTWAEDSNTELHPLTGGKLPKSPVLLWRQERAKSQSQKEQDTFSVAV